MLNRSSKNYDLEERTLNFAREVLSFTSTLSKTLQNVEVIKQVVRSAGSIGANYIEANEALSKKDFSMRAKICRKEAKETCYWLKLLQIQTENSEKTRQLLINESTEIMKIFGAIVVRTTE
jgi:four helix bundle protein